MVTYGIVPNGFGPEILFDGKKRIFFQPSAFYEGIFLALSPDEKKEVLERNNVDYSELEREVMSVKGSKKLTKRKGIQGGDIGGTVGVVVVISRGHGGRSDENKNRTAAYTIMIKGAQMLNGELLDTFDIHCSCKHFLYTGLGEFTNRRTCCAHISAAMYALHEEVDSLKECKPMLKGEVFLPFKIDKDIAAQVVKKRYIDGKRLYDIDVELMSRKEILSPPLEELIEEGRVVFTCSKKKEDYPKDLGIKMWKIRKNLIEMGYKREGIAREVLDKKCYWNYKIDENTDLRIVPNFDDGEIYALKVVYVDDMTRDEVVKKYASQNVGYGRDPMRCRMRVDKKFRLMYFDKSEIKWILGR